MAGVREGRLQLDSAGRRIDRIVDEADRTFLRRRTGRGYGESRRRRRVARAGVGRPNRELRWTRGTPLQAGLDLQRPLPLEAADVGKVSAWHRKSHVDGRH